MHALFTVLLVVRLYDASGAVAPRTAERAYGAAGDILRRAGIEMTWIDCSRTRRGDNPPLSCQTVEPRDLAIRIVRERPTGGGDVLGDAYVDQVARSGVMATVYTEPLRQFALAARADLGVLLGRAIAHEIGHLLLGTTAHAETGLMRAAWTPEQLQRNLPSDWQFLPAEQTELSRHVSMRTGDATPRLTVDAYCQPTVFPFSCSSSHVLSGAK